MMMRRALVLSAWLISAWITPTIAQQAPADCSAIVGTADCTAIVGAASPAPPTSGAAAAPAPAPAAPPYTATFMTSQYGQAGQQQLPGGYSNGLIPYNPATGALDPAFVSALGFGNTPMTVQQFQQYWNSPSAAFGNFGAD
jgi:hypothetical protein